MCSQLVWVYIYIYITYICTYVSNYMYWPESSACWDFPMQIQSLLKLFVLHNVVPILQASRWPCLRPCLAASTLESRRQVQQITTSWSKCYPSTQESNAEFSLPGNLKLWDWIWRLRFKTISPAMYVCAVSGRVRVASVVRAILRMAKGAAASVTLDLPRWQLWRYPSFKWWN